MSTIFSKIINKEIPTDIQYEDDLCIAINDINPKAKIHLLIIPKKEIQNINSADENDQEILGHLLLVCKKLAVDLKISESGYQILTNIGEGGGQTVMHLHFHLLSGNAVTL
ncbi:histidine triad nucleotide-binding protein [Chloroflexi bacterium]|nr:histidine triad nucleotide-binding protein [Chloroflexota bacterium]MDC0252868.1 histidine triad nucleotide-binding protein [Chloroflexota bacterium]RZP14361.1 MAG: histidine triad nucleotide-binding protein [Chloroflexota bacterium]|tara:strand:+ start:5181 stop:5513 length:333 start_codon:yes stop_codon:yes gene_type:complete